MAEGAINPNDGPPIALHDMRGKDYAKLTEALRRSRAETPQDSVVEPALDANVPPPGIVAIGRIEAGVVGPAVPVWPAIVANGRIEAGVVGPTVPGQPNGDPARWGGHLVPLFLPEGRRATHSLEQARMVLWRGIIFPAWLPVLLWQTGVPFQAPLWRGVCAPTHWSPPPMPQNPHSRLTERGD